MKLRQLWKLVMPFFLLNAKMIDWLKWEILLKYSLDSENNTYRVFFPSNSIIGKVYSFVRKINFCVFFLLLAKDNVLCTSTHCVALYNRNMLNHVLRSTEQWFNSFSVLGGYLKETNRAPTLCTMKILTHPEIAKQE